MAAGNPKGSGEPGERRLVVANKLCGISLLFHNKTSGRYILSIHYKRIMVTSH